MKTCKKCGAEMRDEALFCTECGEKLENTEEVIQEEVIQEEVVQEEVIQNEPRKEANLAKVKEILKNKKMMAIVVGALVIVGVIIAFIVNAKNTIKVGDYCVVTYSGGDGFATAKVNLDYESLEAEICERKGVSLDGMAYWSIVDAVEDDGIQVSVTPNEELSNGDKIDIQVDVLNEKAVDGVKLAGGTIKHEVEGLAKYKEITDEDLFKDIEVVYTNCSPMLKVEVKSTSDDPFLRSVTYEVPNSGEIANGDKITIEATWDEGIADNNQCIVVGTGKKELTVEGQAEYLLTKESVSEEMLEEIKKEIEQDYKAAIQNEFIRIKELWLLDKTNQFSNTNKLIALIEIEPSESGKERGAEVYYFDGYYTNVIIRDGKIELGEMTGNFLFNIYTNRNSFDEGMKYEKKNAKAYSNLLESE